MSADDQDRFDLDGGKGQAVADTESAVAFPEIVVEPGEHNLAFESVERRARAPWRGVRYTILILLLGSGGAWAWNEWGAQYLFEPADEVPLIRAAEGPLKERPKVPGGLDVPNRDKLVYGRIEAGAPAQSPPAETLLPRPEVPLPPPTAIPSPAPPMTVTPPPVKLEDATLPIPRTTTPSPEEVIAARRPEPVLKLPTAEEAPPKPSAVSPAKGAVKVPTVKKGPSKPSAAPPANRAVKAPALKKALSKPSAVPSAKKPVKAPALKKVPSKPSAAPPANRAVKVPALKKALSKPSAVPSAKRAVKAPALKKALSKPSAASPSKTSEKLPTVQRSPPNPPSAPPTKTGAATKPSGRAAASIQDYRIQLAAVRSESAARSEWARLHRQHRVILGKLTPNVVRADLGEKGTFFRLRAGPLVDTAAARKLCDALIKKGVGCLVIRPGR